MAFDLWTDGVRLVDRFARLFNVQYIGRDDLSGLVDGSNVVFYSTYHPILSSGSTEVRVSNSVISSGSYTVNHEPGVFTFTNAPVAQPQATYTIARYPDRVIRSVLVAGFDEMELRWFRGLQLSSTVGTGQITLITEDSDNAYVVNSSGSDPPVGGIFFSSSRVQQAFFARCVNLAFLQTLLGEHALSSYIWREAQGLSVDKSRVVQNLLIAKNELEKQMTAWLQQTQVEFGGTATYGGFIAQPLTREYVAHRFWEKASSSEDWRSSTNYTGSLW